jgi:uncharacterized protein YcbX
MATKTTNVVTTGKLCELLQAGPGQVKAAAEAAHVRPVLVVNGRAHFDEEDVPRIRAALSEGKR